ncbi:MAG TPA: DUF1549 domain-containing protein, partial [Chthonomonadales bacterium]|nr:DUF1549 domain-containing protein [Chthonomonadales bacterium]
AAYSSGKSVAGLPPKETIKALIATPKQVVLQGRYTEARVMIDGRTASGSVRDVSREVKLSVLNPKVASVDESGIVRAQADGSTTLVARLNAGPRRPPLVARVPVVVRGASKSGPPRFLTDVMPILTKAGCNQGACHGAASGKGGFKLTLLGYDPELDYETITRAQGARRVTPAEPENSLLLRKPTLRVAHRGGLRFRVGSPEYRLLRDWIAGGLPGPSPKEPHVMRLEVIPSVRTLPVGQTQRFIVLAHYSDETRRDVTAQTLFTANDETVATVTPDGEAKATGPGEGAIVIRYRGLVATACVISPFGTPWSHTARLVSHTSTMDRLVMQKLAALGLKPSGRSSDTDFLRRAYLDVIGMLPTPAEVRAFVADRDPQKRAKLINALLERPEYVDFWTMKWADLLRCSRRILSEKGMYTFYNWIRRSVAENKPWDQFVRELLLAGGSTYQEGPANFFRTANKPEELAEATSQVFLGVRIQCARCHNHPYEKWTQNQYWQMAAFFAQMKAKQGNGERELLVYASNSGEVKHPKTQRNVTPCALDSSPLPATYRGDRREALVNWLTSPQNPFFARILVNRIWRHLMGRGLVEPVDDMRVTNPPSNEALLDWLAQDFVQHGYNLKYLIRSIMLSETYQRSAEPIHGNERDTRYYSHYPFKRLGAEQLMDAIASATGVPEKFNGYPAGIRAVQLPDTAVPSYFLELFGRPARNTTCECERSDEPNLGQVLHLMNNASINAKLSAKNGRVASLIEAKLPDARVVEELYLASVSRFPTPQEKRQATKLLARAKNRQQAAEDILWALMNSKEFVFNH